MAGPVVDAALVAEGLRQVGAQLRHLGGIGEVELRGVPGRQRGGDVVEEGAEDGVAEARARVFGRVLEQDLLDVGEDAEDVGDDGREGILANGRARFVAHAVGDAEDEGGDERACWALEEERVVGWAEDAP